MLKFVGCASALPMGVAPEATCDCLQSDIGSFLQRSSEILTAHFVFLVQPCVQESMKLMARCERLKASRAVLRETVEKTTGEFFLLLYASGVL